MNNKEYKEILFELVDMNSKSMELINDIMKEFEKLDIKVKLVEFNDCLTRQLKKMDSLEEKVNKIINK